MEAVTIGYIAEGKEKTLEAIETVVATLELVKNVKFVQVKTTTNTNPDTNGDTIVEINVIYNNGGVT